MLYLYDLIGYLGIYIRPKRSLQTISSIPTPFPFKILWAVAYNTPLPTQSQRKAKHKNTQNHNNKPCEPELAVKLLHDFLKLMELATSVSLAVVEVVTCLLQRREIGGGGGPAGARGEGVGAGLEIEVGTVGQAPR